MIQSVTIRQATKAGIAIWRVGGGGSLFPNIQNEKRQGAGRWKHMPNPDGKQSRDFQIGGRCSEKIQNQEINTKRVLEAHGILR